MESQHDKQANLKLRQQIFYEKEKIYKFKLSIIAITINSKHFNKKVKALASLKAK